MIPVPTGPSGVVLQEHGGMCRLGKDISSWQPQVHCILLREQQGKSD